MGNGGACIRRLVDDAVAGGAVGLVRMTVTWRGDSHQVRRRRPRAGRASIAPSTPIMCVRSSPLSTLAGLSMRIATGGVGDDAPRGHEDSNQERGYRVGARPARPILPPAATITAREPGIVATSRNAASC